MVTRLDPHLILPRDIAAAKVTNPTQSSGVVLVCEHASAYIPPSLDDLGLSAEARHSHAAWDIGALDVAQTMSRLLDAPLVQATTSRLVYDCNRPPDAPSAMPARSERYDVPGNAGLTLDQQAQRVAEIYAPFTATIRDQISAQTTPPAVVTIHSFTPVYNGAPRDTEIGLLHDQDATLARAMQDVSAAHTPLRVDLNRPYDRADGVTHTLALNGTANALHNVMIEVRNDLIDTPATARAMAQTLVSILRAALSRIQEASP